LNSFVYLGFLPIGAPPSHRSGSQVSTKPGQAHRIEDEDEDDHEYGYGYG
jgi:hypothetical protein